MSARKGFLMVSMEPPPQYDEEFNDWYDMEHIPERSRIPGFETARRFVCVSGWPKYLSFYDLAEIGVLESEPYKKASWGGFSAWTKRMLPKVRGQYRASGDQIYPGNALTGNLARLTLIRFRGRNLMVMVQSSVSTGRKVATSFSIVASPCDSPTLADGPYFDLYS